MSASPKPKLVAADPALWRKGFLDLRPSVSPCPGLTGATWAATYGVAISFLDQWADEAAALGWTTLDLFGVHPGAGAIRADFCGALVLATEPITGVAPQRMTWMNATYRRDTPGRPSGAVPLWLFGK